MKNFVSILFVCFVVFDIVCGAWVEPQVATRALDAQGYSDIHITDQSWFFVGWQGCGAGDNVRFTAKAKNPAGKPTEVYVCSGFFFKGSTIRTQ